MTLMSILFKKELAEIFAKKKNLLAMLLAPVLLIVISLTVYPNLIDSMAPLIAPSILVPKMLDIYGFNFTLFLVLMVQTTIAADLFVAEKTRKSIELTLTTPVNAKDVLFGKVLTIFAVGYPLSLVSFFAVAFSLWAKYGFYLPSIYTLLYLALILPAISILLLAVLGAIQLGTRAYAIGTMVLVAVMWVTVFVPSFFMSDMPNAQTMFLIYTAVLAILGLAVYRINRMLLSKERIVTSA